MTYEFLGIRGEEDEMVITDYAGDTLQIRFDGPGRLVFSTQGRSGGGPRVVVTGEDLRAMMVRWQREFGGPL